MDMAENSCCKESIRKVFRLQIEELVKRLFAFGEESFFMSAKVDESNLHVLGSEKGRAYMREYVGVPKGFIPFLQEEQVKSAGNKTASLICTAMDQKSISNNLTSRKTDIGIYETNRFSTEKENEEVRQRGEQDDSRDLQDRSTETERAIVDQTSLEGPERGLQEPTVESRPDGKGEKKLDMETVPDKEISTIGGSFQDVECESAQANNIQKNFTNSSVIKLDSNQLEDTSLDWKGTTENTDLSVENVNIRGNVVGRLSADSDLKDTDTDNVTSISNSRSVCFQNTRSTNSNNNCSNNAGIGHTYVYNDGRLVAMGEEENLSGQETAYDSSESDSDRDRESNESDDSDDGEYVEMEMEEILNDENNATVYKRRIKPTTKGKSVDSRIIYAGSDVGALRSCKRKSKEEKFTSRSKMGTKWKTLHGKNTPKNVPHSNEGIVNLMTEVHKKEVESIKASSKQMDGSYNCKICKKFFKHKRSDRLSEHIISRHLQEKMFACGLCKKGFASARNVAQHLKTSCKKKIKSSSASKGNSSDA